jgi:hypothetical protein
MSTNDRSSVAHDIALAEHLIEKGMAEEAEVVVERLEKAAAQAAAADDDEDDGDEMDDGIDEEDDADEDDTVAKLGPRKTPPRYPGDPSHPGLHYPEDDLTDVWQNHQNIQPMKTSRHRTAFDDHVDRIKARDGVPKTEAMRRARVEHPQAFLHAQRLDSGGTFKSAPSGNPLTYEAAVAAEIEKGCSQVVAETRVTERWGSTLPRSTISKGESLITSFMAAVDECMANNPGMERCQAMRKVREYDPEAFEIFSEV